MKVGKLSLFLSVFLFLTVAFSGCAVKNDKENSVVEKNGEIIVLFTGDVHCGVDQGFGYVGLQSVRDSLTAQGFETILVDTGDAVQGEIIGTLTKGEAIIELMNELEYDVAIPGNHEFDYGTEHFLNLVDKAEFPYISCNFTHNGELVFSPYIIKECAGMKIAFVGVTTPRTITSSSPAYFKDENGEFVYGFMQDETGEKVYSAVQSAVDSAREEGADLVYLLAHLGFEADAAPWTYADVISNTSGVDALFDAHSHDSERVEMKNKNGKTVVRVAGGTKMNCIGYSRVSADKKIAEIDVWTWNNSVSAPELFGLNNKMTAVVKNAIDKTEEKIGQKIAESEELLTIYNPYSSDSHGNKIRMVRRSETNLGDFCADAYRFASGADVALINGGGIRADIAKGDITYRDVISVHPFGNEICVVKATGQQIVDALEWGARVIPTEFGGFLQVSGMRYEIDLTIESGCVADENGMFIGVEGERRVKNVYIGEEPVVLDKLYTVAGTNYTLLNNGDGQTSFNGAELMIECVKLDNQALIDYITDGLNGVIGEKYSDPFGDGRIGFLGAMG